MAEVREFSNDKEVIIQVKLDEKDTRVCDYCNKTLVTYDEKQKKLICVENCYSTYYGLLCEGCIGNIEAIKSFKKQEQYIEIAFDKETKYDEVIQKFRSKRTGKIYEVILTERGLSCNCKGWIYHRFCKHIEYVLRNLALKDEKGRITCFVSELSRIPSYEEAKRMEFGRNKTETKKWLNENMKVIEI